MSSMLTSSVRKLFIFIQFTHFRVVKKKQSKNQKKVFLVKHIPEKVEFLFVRKRVVEKCIGHGYVVFE